MVITQVRAMVRRFGLWALPLAAVVMLLYSLRSNRRTGVLVIFVLVFAGIILAGTRLHHNSSLHISTEKPGFSITDLGLPAGYSGIVAASINNEGQIVGYLSSNGDQNRHRQPFVWKEGVIKLIDMERMQSGIATCINDRGAVGGYCTALNNSSRATLWITDKMHLLDSPDGRSTFALRINNGQLICGVATGTQSTDAVVWNNGQIRTILRSGSVCSCEGLNDGGEVVGTELIGSFIIEAYRYHDGKLTYLPGLGGDGDGARSINNSGDIVGWAEYAGNWNQHAAYWHDGSVEDLGTLGGDASDAVCINSRSEIIGWSKIRNGTIRPFMWRSGKMVDVNNLLPKGSNWTLESVSAINDTGQMIGIGEHNNQSRAFLLTPQR